jgi:hypothetical protein
MEEKIDFGKITVPTSWDEISLRQFQEIEKYYKENKDFDVRDIIHILTNKTRDEINELPVEFLEIILQKLSFMNEQPKVEKPTNKIELNGQIYQVNIMNKLKAGEYIAVDSVVKSDASNFAAILAVVCRKDGELFDSKYENEVLEERMKMFENAPITKILPIVNFFLQCYTMSNGLSQLYSKVEEGISLMRQNIQDSAKNGVFTKLYSKWQMRKLKKLEKSLKSISLTT